MARSMLTLFRQQVATGGNPFRDHQDKGEVMAKPKEIVHVGLDPVQLSLVDMYRHGVKVRTGKMPTRSVAIAELILTATQGVQPTALWTYAELVKAAENHGDRIDELEAAIVPLLEATEAKGK